MRRSATTAAGAEVRAAGDGSSVTPQCPLMPMCARIVPHTPPAAWDVSPWASTPGVARRKVHRNVVVPPSAERRGHNPWRHYDAVTAPACLLGRSSSSISRYGRYAGCTRKRADLPLSCSNLRAST